MTNSLKQSGRQILWRDALVAAILLLSPVAATAQQTIENLGLNQGAETEPGYELRPTVTATYISNVFSLSDAAQRSNRSLSVDDYRFVPRLIGSISAPVGRNTVSLSGNVGYRRYTNNSQLDSFDFGGGGRFDFARYGRCGGFASAEYRQYLRNFDDVQTAQTTLEQIQYYAAGADCIVARNVNAVGVFQFQEADNARSGLVAIPASSTNFNTTIFEGKLGYGDIEHLQFSLVGRYRHYAQPNFLLPSGGRGQASTIYAGGIGAVWKPQERFSVSFNAQYSGFENNIQTNAIGDFVGGIDLTWRPSPNLSTQFSINRDFTASNSFASSRYINTSFTNSTTVHLTARTQAVTDLRVVLRNINLLQQGSTSITRQNDTFFNVQERIVYPVAERLLLEVGGSYYNRTSNQNGGGFTGITGTIRLTYTFGTKKAETFRPPEER